MKDHLHVKLPVSTNGFFAQTSPFHLPLLKSFLSFVLQTCLWFTIDYMS